MSFMAGFGSAYSNSFENSRDRAAKRKDDIFKMTYTDLVSKRDKYEEWKREDGKAARKAEAILERAGGDPKIYPWVYKQVKGGIDDENIINDLRTGSFDVKDAAQAAKAGPEAAAPDPMAAQMQESGMAPPEAPVAPEAPVPVQPQGPGGGIMKALGIGGGRQEREIGQAREKAARMAGMSPEDANIALTGGYESPEPDASGISFTPGAPARKADPMASLNEAYIEQAQAHTSGDPQRIAIADERVAAIMTAETVKAELDAKAKGITLDGAPATIWKDGEYAGNARVKRQPDGTYTDLKGNPIDGEIAPVSKDENDLMLSTAQSLQKPLTDHNARAENHLSAIRSYATMSDIVERTQGAVLAPITSSVFQTGAQWITDAATFADQVQKIAGSGEDLPENGEAWLESAEKKLLSEGGNDLATQKGLFEVQKALMAYRLGAAMGQEGRALAETERKLFTDMAAGGVTPDRFHQGMSDILLGNARNIDSEGDSIINNDQNLKVFVDRYGYVPRSFAFNSLQKKLEMTDDPDLKKAYGNLLDFDRREMPDMAPAPQDTPPQIAPAGPAMVPVGEVKIGRGGLKYEFQGGNPLDKNSWKRID